MSPKDASWGGRLAWRGSNPPPPPGHPKTRSLLPGRAHPRQPRVGAESVPLCRSAGRPWPFPGKGKRRKRPRERWQEVWQQHPVQAGSPECCPRASREVPASCPEQPGFRQIPGSPQTVPARFAARSHEPAETQLCLGGGYEGKGSHAGRASAGQAGTSPAQAPRGWELRDREPRGWARTEGASLQAGTRSPHGPGLERRWAQAG